MLTGDVRPTTLKGLKSLASEIRKERGIKHSIALDLAAQEAGYSNFRHAQNRGPRSKEKTGNPYVLLSIYWLDKDRKYARGRETLKIELSRSILEICGKTALKKVRGFVNLRMVADDHFISDHLATSQARARELICTAARSIRFMEYTRLRPALNFRESSPKTLAQDELPNNDHATSWVDPASNQFILVDEPYRNATDPLARASWAARKGWRVLKTTWPGMYRPHECDLYVATSAIVGYDLDAIVTKINSIPEPTVAESWLGESSPSWDTFVSPTAKTAQDTRRARCRETVYPMASAKSLPYSYQFGSTKRRPIGKLGISGHIEAGSIIKAVMNSPHRPITVWSRLNNLRSTLEDWMGLEIHRDELQDSEFLGIYYGKNTVHQNHVEKANSQTGNIELLAELRRCLQGAYSECLPLRRQLNRIELSIVAIEKMNSLDS